ncbi:MAG TPA: hypothetical protein VNB24_09065 [Acidimicrobiales bacterium]|nr:hypothetical protein [Acidimicrobiales bacterium]
MTTAQVFYEEVKTLLGALMSTYDPPAHVCYRVGALLAVDEPLEYTDVCVSKADDGTVGDVVVFTSDRVIRARFTDPFEEDFASGDSCSADVSTWARHDLERITIAGPEGSNVDQTWSADQGELWPLRAFLTLHYSQPPGELVLPFHKTAPTVIRQRFRAFVPSLLEDLNRLT